MKTKLYTLKGLAVAWDLTEMRLRQMYAEGKLPKPDGFYNDHKSRPYWFSIPERPSDRRTWPRTEPKK